VQGNPAVIQNVTDVECASGCEVLAVAADEGIFLLDASDFAQVGFIRSEETISSVAASPDGRLLAAALSERILIFDILDRVPVLEIPGTRGARRDLSFSPDGSTLAAAREDAIGLWSVETGSWLADMSLPPLTVEGFEGYPGTIYRMMFTPDGGFLTAPVTSAEFERNWQLRRGHMSLSELAALNAAYLDSPLPMILIWSLSEGSVGTSFPGEAAAFSPDGAQILSTWGGAVELREAESASLEGSIDAPGVGSAVEDIAISDDGGQVAIAAWDAIGCGASIGVWDIASGEQAWLYCYDSELPAVGPEDDQSRLSGGIMFSPSGDTLFVWRSGTLLALSAGAGSVAREITHP
jgi:hypothetical protein